MCFPSLSTDWGPNVSCSRIGLTTGDKGYQVSKVLKGQNECFIHPYILNIKCMYLTPKSERIVQTAIRIFTFSFIYKITNGFRIYWVVCLSDIDNVHPVHAPSARTVCRCTRVIQASYIPC